MRARQHAEAAVGILRGVLVRQSNDVDDALEESLLDAEEQPSHLLVDALQLLGDIVGGHAEEMDIAQPPDSSALGEAVKYYEEALRIAIETPELKGRAPDLTRSAAHAAILLAPTQIRRVILAEHRRQGLQLAKDDYVAILRELLASAAPSAVIQQWSAAIIASRGNEQALWNKLHAVYAVCTSGAVEHS